MPRGKRRRAGSSEPAAEDGGKKKKAEEEGGEADAEGQEGGEREAGEPGEVVLQDEKDEPMLSASRAWELDLKRPPKERVIKSPLVYACQHGKPIKGGLWLEFGVFSGKTINLMSQFKHDGKVYGFDTFEGLPEDWRNTHKKGTFDVKGRFPPVGPNVELVKGLFQDTLEPFLNDLPASDPPQPVAVAHLDADLYSATIYVLKTLATRIVPGTLLVFDELINFENYEEHEWKALLEATFEFKWEFEWVAQASELVSPVVHEIQETQQVALRITKVK